MFEVDGCEMIRVELPKRSVCDEYLGERGESL